MTLRDAVTTSANTISGPAREWAARSRDASRSLADRSAAFHQLIEEEIGRTWLRSSRGLARDFDRPGVFLKFEGDNPTGTQKDRIAFAQVAEALTDGYETVCLATCGNYGVAVALACHLAGLRCRVFVPAGFHSKRIGEMESLGAELFRPPGSYEDAVRLSSEEAARSGDYDANPGGKNASLQLRAYAGIATEIVDTMPEPPATVAVPVSNGTLLAGIHRGFVDLVGQGRIAELPRMVAASSTQKNPIVSSFLSGSRECRDLDPARVRETLINEPLINWHSFDGQEALEALYASQGAARHVSDRELLKMAAYLRQKEALNVLPAATAGLVALTDPTTPFARPAVAILTAKR
jgi:threonine synthase